MRTTAETGLGRTAQRPFWPVAPGGNKLRKAGIEGAFEREGHLRTRIIRITARQPEKKRQI
jgi:hypothetical protein